MATEQKYDITVRKGDTYNGCRFDFLLNSAVIDIESAKMQVKRREKAETALLELTSAAGLTITSSAVAIDAQIFDIVSGEFYYDLELTLTNQYVKTWVYGNFIVEQDVTE